MTCPYINSLKRACGRASTHGPFCGLHYILHTIEREVMDETKAREFLKRWSPCQKITARLHTFVNGQCARCEVPE